MTDHFDRCAQYMYKDTIVIQTFSANTRMTEKQYAKDRIPLIFEDVNVQKSSFRIFKNSFPLWNEVVLVFYDAFIKLA